MITQTKKNDFHQKHKGVSPILATVILLAVTVVGGGVTFALLSSGTQTAASQNIIAIENAQGVKGTDHADITATIKNAGSKPWVQIEMTVGKSELSEPLLYESLHENVVGCDGAAGTCQDGIREVSGAEGNRDNPLRAQWIASLDKLGGETDRADPGEGISVGRKFVFDNQDDLRTVTILNGTAVAPLFGGFGVDNEQTLSTDMDELVNACTPSAAGTFTGDCTAVFDALDPVSGNVFCGLSTNDNIAAVCQVFTHTSIEDDPIAPGESKYFYADAFTKEIPGLNNLVIRVGDALVVNLVAEDVDGGTTRAQTIIKVTGV